MPDQPESSQPDQPPVPEPAPANARPPAPAVAPPRPSRRWQLAAIIAAAVLLLAGGAYALVRYLDEGPAAPVYAAYAKRLEHGFTTRGTLHFTTPDTLAIFDTDISYDGAYDASRPDQPVSRFSFSGKFASKPYQGQSATKAGKLYFNLTGPDLPTIRYDQSETFLYSIKSGQWFVNRHDRSLYGTYCEARSDSKYPGADFPQRVLAALKLRQAKLVDANANVDGHPAAHYQAKLNNASLATALNLVNSEFPQGCRLRLTGYDLVTLPVTYDLWTGQGFDKTQLSFSALGSQLVWTNQTGDYGRPVDPQLPTNPIDLNQIWPPPQ